MEHILPILAGPFIGSFLGVLVKRVPVGRLILWGRSSCDACGHSLRMRDLIPLLSWLRLRGRCAHCGARIGAFEPAIELAATAVAAWAVLAGGSPLPEIWANCCLGWALLALGSIDAKHLRLPDVLTLPLTAAGLAVTWFHHRDLLVLHVVGAVAGFLVFQAIATTYRLLRGREGLGGGDAKLLAAGGAWVGADQLPPIILVAAVAALIWVLVRRPNQGIVSATTAIAFGPFLALAIWLVRLHGSSDFN